MSLALPAAPPAPPRRAGWLRTIQSQLLTALAVLLVLEAGSAGISLAANSAQDRAYEAADRARATQLTLARLQETMVDQESGLRGYSSTADPVYLEPYDTGRKATPALERSLEASLGAGAPALQRLEQAIAQWQAWAEQRRQQILAGGVNTDIQVINRGKALFDQVRASEAAVGGMVQAAVNHELGAAQDHSNQQAVALLAGALTAGLIAVLVAILVVRWTLRPLGNLILAARGLAAGLQPVIPAMRRQDEVGQLARALERWQVAEAERAALVGAMVDVSEQVEEEAVIQHAAARLLDVLAADQVVISLVGDGGGTVVASEPHPFDPGRTLPAGSPGGRALRDRRPLVTDLRDPGWDEGVDRWRTRHGLGPALAAPLISGGEPVGVATLLRHEASQPFDDSDLRRAELVFPFVAAALHVARVFGDLSRANVELERATQMKSEFLASMSHELRTPLNSILGFSELLLEYPEHARDPDRLKRYLTNIHSSGQHLLGLINDILDLSKIEAGKMTLNVEPVGLSTVVDPVMATVEPLAAAKNIRLTWELPPSLTLLGDSVRLKQILLNLLSNAVKFTPEGGTVTLSARQTSTQAEIRVADTGMGIAPDDQARIFEEFQQVQNESTRHVQGTGLGLALTKRFVEMHGGRISVESELGSGSVFTVLLPLGGEAAGAAAEDAEPDAGDERPTVLVIEDDRQAAALIVEYLRQAGYRSIVARTAAAALQLAVERRPVAITLDILLPDGDGHAILASLRTEPATRDIPVIVVSVTDDRSAAMALGAVDHLVKPIDRDTLLGAIAAYARRPEQPARVLVVDDDPSTLTLVREGLSSAGMEVVETLDGGAAIERARAERFDVVLVDLMMPGIGGLEVIDALRAEPATAELPVILMTAKTLDDAERADLSARVGNVLHKADHSAWENLVDRVRAATAGQGGEPAPTH